MHTHFIVQSGCIVVAHHKYLRAYTQNLRIVEATQMHMYFHIIVANWMHVRLGCNLEQIIEAECGAENMQDIRMPKTFIESFLFAKLGMQ